MGITMFGSESMRVCMCKLECSVYTHCTAGCDTIEALSVVVGDTAAAFKTVVTVGDMSLAMGKAEVVVPCPFNLSH